MAKLTFQTPSQESYEDELAKDLANNNINSGMMKEFLDQGLVRRITPLTMSAEIGGIQPMTSPAGVVFSIKPRYTIMNVNTCKCPCHDNSAIMHVGKACCDFILPVTLT